MDRIWTTLTALAAPRRLVPIALVLAALVAVQIEHAGALRPAVIPVAMTIGFVALGPWSYRALLAGAGNRAVGWLVYVAGAIAVVGASGVALPALLDTGPTFLTDAGSLFIAGVLYLIGSWGLGRDIELEQDLVHSRLLAVRRHLDPHFLFNTLNAIAEWCREDPRVAEDATVRLASMLRDVMDALERTSWPLERELAVTGDLLELHRVRDPDAFSLAFDIDPAAGATPVPPLILVSLAENAVKHGPRKGHRGTIRVHTASSDGRIEVAIENPGRFEPAGAGRGLTLLRQRLAVSSGPRARLDIATAGDDRTRAAIVLPARAP